MEIIGKIFRKIKFATNTNSKKILFLFYLLLFLSAFIGADVWKTIAIKYKIEFGLIAILIGFLCGGVGLLFKREENQNFYIINSIVFSLIGYFIGKFWIYYNIIQSSNYKETISMIYNLYLYNFDFYEILWIVLVGMTALRVATTDYRLIDPEYKLMKGYDKET